MKIENLKLKINRTHRTYLVLFVLLFFFFVLPTNSAHAATLSRPPSNLGLVGYWPMDEGAGVKATDASGNRNNADISGTPVWVNGRHGKALSTNGNTASTQNATNLNNTSQLTVSIWLYARSEVVGYAVHPFNKWGSGTGDANFVLYYFGTTSGENRNLRFHANAGGTWQSISASYNISLNTWYHVVLVYNSATGGQLYVNGKPIGGLTASGALASNTGGINMGGLDGIVDDARIYSRALSATEVAKLYSSGQITRKQTSSSGLVGYWSMDDNAGNKVTDSSGNNNAGTITGGTWANGLKGKALSFNGSSDKVFGGNVTVATTMTIAGWIKKNTSTGQKSFFSNRGGGNVYFGLDGTKVFLYDNAGTAPNITSSSGAVKIGEWQHVAVTSNGTTTTFYVNGLQVSSTGQTRTSSTGTFGIGWDPSIGSEYWDGLIDDVRVYNRALTATEIQNLYKQNQTIMNTSQVGKLTNGLVGYWSFNGKDVSGATVYDRSGNGNNGTTTGATKIIGKAGQALSFDGSSNYVEIGNASSLNLNNLTASAWIKPQVGAVGIFGKWGSVPYYYIMLSSNDLCIRLANTVHTTYCVSSPVIPYNDWSFISISVDSTNLQLKIYVNGGIVKTTAIVSGEAGPYTNSNNFNIGNIGNSLSGYYFKGYLDEVRVYNRVLSADEVKQLYNLGK